MASQLKPEQRTKEYWLGLMDKWGSPGEIEANVGHAASTIRKALKKYGIPYDHSPTPLEYRKVEAPPFDVPILKAPELDWPNCIIGCDSHVPYHNIELYNELLAVARKFGIKRFLHNGDLIDLKALFSKDVQEGETRMWTEEIDEAKRLIESLLGTFDEIVATAGNHEWRMARILKDEKKAGWLFKNLWEGNGKFTWHDFNYIKLCGWLYVTHPFTQRAVKLSLAESLGNIHRGSHITTHTHRFGFGVHNNGEEIIGDGLHLTRPECHDYHEKRLGVFAKWVPGFWMVLDNKVYPYVKHGRIFNPLESRAVIISIRKLK